MVSTNTALGPVLEDARAILPDLVEVRRPSTAGPRSGSSCRRRRPSSWPSSSGSDSPRTRDEPQLGDRADRGHGRGRRRGPTILLRADMDGLPLTEEDTGSSSRPSVAGAMHACGHDTHMAMLLGAARLLVARRERLAGRVLLMFQPGEEGYHGARFMLDEGLLEMARRRRR